MTAASATAVKTAAPAGTRTRVGWGDLLWLTWRQHRWMIIGTAAVAVAVTALALGMAWHTDATGDTHRLLGRWGYLGTTQALSFVPTVAGGVIALFWAAPLLSREYEQRTHLVVWSQDVTPLRWLAAKAVLLGVIAAALAAGLGMALIKLMNSINAVMADFAPFRPFESGLFEAAPQVQVGYAAFGFALGLAFSAVTRRTVLSMGLTVGVFVAVRGLVASAWRPYFQEPVRVIEPFDAHTRSSNGFWGAGGKGSWAVDGGYSDASGKLVPFPKECGGSQTLDDFGQCMNDKGVHYLSEFHPVERLAAFQWFEFGIFAVLAAGLFALAFVWVRRARRV
jgi:hypothetical protein